MDLCTTSRSVEGLTALLLDEEGRKLAKRRGSPAIADYRKAGEDGRGWADKLRTAQWPCGISLGKAHI